MEEENKEEINEEVKEEIIVEKPKRSTKSKVMTVMLCVALFCVLSILIFAIFGSDLLPFNQGNDNKQQEEKKKEEKEESTKILTIYRYDNGSGDEEVTTSKKDGYDFKIDYNCSNKECKLLNEGQSPWARNNTLFAIINDNNKTVIIDFKTKSIIKTDIIPTDKTMDDDVDGVRGPVFKYKDKEYSDLRVVEDETNKNNIFIKLSYADSKENVFVLVYDLTKNQIVEGRNYPLHDGMEYSFDDEYKVVFSEEKNEKTKDYKIISKGSKVNFELRDYNGTKKLYISEKLIDDNEVPNISSIIEVHEIDDILLVVVYDADAYCQKLYYLNNNGKKIGTFNTKLEDTSFEEVKGKEIYAYSFVNAVIHQDTSSVCTYKDTDIIYVQEKMIYLGDNKFSEKEIVKSQNKKEYIEARSIDCSNNTSTE